MTREFLLIAGAMLLVAGPPAWSQGVPDNGTQALINQLNLTPEQLARMRGIIRPQADPGTVAPGVLREGGPVAPVAAVGARPRLPAGGTAATPGTASITVNFATGSAALSPQAVLDLAQLGRALASSQLAAFSFRLEGHTDTMGDAGSNMALSQRRAEAVREFLVTRFDIAPARLVAVGLGEGQLLVATGDNVNEPRNRRVQVLNLGD